MREVAGSGAVLILLIVCACAGRALHEYRSESAEDRRFDNHGPDLRPDQET